MSWSVTRTSIPYADYETAFEAMQKEASAQSPGNEDQIDSAINAAGTIIEDGAVGDTDKLFTVSISGHSNPEHAPRAGYANDMINVSVIQS